MHVPDLEYMRYLVIILDNSNLFIDGCMYIMANYCGQASSVAQMHKEGCSVSIIVHNNYHCCHNVKKGINDANLF